MNGGLRAHETLRTRNASAGAALLWILVTALIAGCAGPRASSSRASMRAGSGGAEVIEGTLVDTRCYSIDPKFRSNDHDPGSGTIESCAPACAHLGMPVGLLTDQGQIFVLLAPAPEFESVMGLRARAIGSKALSGAAFRPDSVAVKDGVSWRPVDMHIMM